MNEQSGIEPSIHRSVLHKEVLKALDLKEGARVLDGTVNGGGNEQLFGEKIGMRGILIGVDLDGGGLERDKERLKESPAKVMLVEESFRNMDKAAKLHKVAAFDAILLDLGFSSDQLEQSGRGFSFKKDEPLLLTF